jgi:hypothetical protein
MKKIIIIKILICIFIVCFTKNVNCEIEKITNDSGSKEDVEHLIEEEILLNNKNLKDGPIKIEIVGDSKHLFSDEDFEKKEVVLLRENNQSNSSQVPSVQSNDDTNKTNAPKRKNQSTNPNQSDCLNSNLTVFREKNTVQLVNGSRLSSLLSESEANQCFLVLFYVPWCPFSTRLAPIYNALPKAFPNLDLLAFDVSKSIG